MEHNRSNLRFDLDISVRPGPTTGTADLDGSFWFLERPGKIRPMVFYVFLKEDSG